MEIEIANHKTSIGKLYEFLSTKNLRNHIIAMHNAIYFGWSDVFENETKKLAAENLSDEDVFSLAEAQDREKEMEEARKKKEKLERETAIFNSALVVGMIIYIIMESQRQIVPSIPKSTKFSTLLRKPFWADKYDASTLEMAESSFGQASHTAAQLVKIR